ncbi:766_t:CDS:2, partial [Acaulospora morrowiae]
EVENFDVCANIETRNLSLGTIEELKDCVSKCISEKMGFDKPLWRAYVIYGLEGGKRSAMVIKAHHCIADGQGCMRALMSLTLEGSDLLSDMIKFFKDKMIPPPKPKPSELPLLRHHAIKPHVDRIPEFLFAPYVLFLNVLYILWLLYNEIRTGIINQHKTTKMSLMRKNLIYEESGKLERTMSWTKEINITDISIPRKAYGVSLNDVMAVITRAIRAYFSEINRVLDDELMMFIPISMRGPTNWECNNASTGEWCFISMKEQTTKESIFHVHREMNKLKSSLPAKLRYIFLGNCPIPGIFNKRLMTALEEVGHGVITNVPGPMHSLTFAGQKIEQFTVTPPQNCPGGFAIGIISYDGKITCSVFNDRMPNYPNISTRVTELINEEFEALLEESRAELKKRELTLHEKKESNVMRFIQFEDNYDFLEEDPKPESMVFYIEA